MSDYSRQSSHSCISPATLCLIHNVIAYLTSHGDPRPRTLVQIRLRNVYAKTFPLQEDPVRVALPSLLPLYICLRFHCFLRSHGLLMPSPGFPTVHICPFPQLRFLYIPFIYSAFASIFSLFPPLFSPLGTGAAKMPSLDISSPPQSDASDESILISHVRFSFLSSYLHSHPASKPTRAAFRRSTRRRRKGE